MSRGPARDFTAQGSLRQPLSQHRFRFPISAQRRQQRVRLRSSVLPIETFPALERAGCVHGFVRRIPGIELSHDKAAILENLDQVHREARHALGLLERKFVTARQVHGNNVAVIDSVPADDKCFERCDGLITNQRDVCLGVYVADCCAIYLVDQNARAIALVHSGKKGTALGIAGKAI